MHCLSNTSKYWRIKYSLPRKWHQCVARWSNAKQGEARCRKIKQGVASSLPRCGGKKQVKLVMICTFHFEWPSLYFQFVAHKKWPKECKRYHANNKMASLAKQLPLFVWPTLTKTQFSRIHLNDFAERGKDTLQQHCQCSSGQSM